MELRECLQQKEDWWWYGVVGGLLVVPATATTYWQTGSRIPPAAIVLGALVVGYVAERRSAYEEGIGARVGVVGALPILWGGYDLVGYILGLSYTLPLTVVNLGLLVVGAGVLFGVAALFGEVGAKVGCRLAGRTGRGRRASHSHQ